MKKILFVFTMVASLFSCQAEILQVRDIKEIFEHLLKADSETLVIFDVDRVLIHPKDPAFQEPNMRKHKPTVQKVMEEIPVHKQMLFFTFIAASHESVLIDPEISDLLQSLQERGVPAIALTANITGEFISIPNMANWRIEDLKNLGIDFSKTAPSSSSIVFDQFKSYRSGYPIYKQGIQFTNGSKITKGEAFLALLEKTGYAPKKIVFIDDVEANLISLEKAVVSLPYPVDYSGFHFLGYEDYPSLDLSQEEFEARWRKCAVEMLKID